MADNTDAQADAALNAARARAGIAERITQLAPHVESEADAELLLRLAEAYANLAAEPPRVRAV